MVDEAQREELKVREGESPEEWKARVDGLSDKWAQEHLEKLRAEREGRREESRLSGSSALSMVSRAKSQERDVERAVSEFEAAKKHLYRRDGTQMFSDEEHAERLGKLTGELRERAEVVAQGATEDAEGYERDVLALSYADPASMVPASERSRLEASRAFVKEDCEGLAAPALVERLGAVSAGEDRVAKVLHARYGRMRLAARETESGRLAAEGRPAGADRAREDRALGDAVRALEAALEDPKAAKKARALEEAARESRRVAREAKARLSQADGSGAAAREAARAEMLRAF